MYRIEDKDIEKVLCMLDCSPSFEYVDGVSYDKDNCRMEYLHYYEDDDSNDVIVKQINGTWYCSKNFEELLEMI